MTNDELIKVIIDYYDNNGYSNASWTTNESKVYSLLNSHSSLRQKNMKAADNLEKMSALKRWIYFKFFVKPW